MPEAPLLQVDHTAPYKTICTATGELKTYRVSALLAIPSLPLAAASTGYIILGFTNNLLSLGKQCYANCTAHLNKHSLVVQDSAGNTVLLGAGKLSGPCLWQVNIAQAQPTPHLIPPDKVPPSIPTLPLWPPMPTIPPCTSPTVTAYDLLNTSALIAYLHANAGYPVKSM